MIVFFSALVDGQWSDWSPWLQCNVTCGGGIQERYRICTQPKHGGSDCPGDEKEYQACNTDHCPGTMLYLRDNHFLEICSLFKGNTSQIAELAVLNYYEPQMRIDITSSNDTTNRFRSYMRNIMKCDLC